MVNPYEKKTDEVAPEVTPIEEKQDLLPDLNELDRLHIARYFGMENLGDIKNHSDKLQRLVEYAKSKGAKTRDEIGAIVTGLKNRVGGSMMDVSTYAYLEMERTKIDNQIKEMDNGRISR